MRPVLGDSDRSTPQNGRAWLESHPDHEHGVKCDDEKVNQWLREIAGEIDQESPPFWGEGGKGRGEGGREGGGGRVEAGDQKRPQCVCPSGLYDDPILRQISPWGS